MILSQRIRTPVARLGLILGFAAGAFAAAATQESVRSEAAPAGGDLGDEEIRIREIFTSHLPMTMPKAALRGWIHPHAGDFTDKDSVRVSTGVRYGLTPITEIGAGFDFFVSHGFGDLKAFERSGMVNVQANVKVALGEALLRGWKSAVGLDYVLPVAHPPADVTDGLRHALLYASFSRQLPRRPNLRVFWSLGADAVQRVWPAGQLRKNDLGDHSVLVSGGVVLDHRPLYYTFETTVGTTRLFGEADRNALTLRPGIIWEVPSKKGAGMGFSNWIVGGALRAVFGPDGTDLGASVKVRVNFDLKHWYKPGE